jgi:hypothetical protein
MRWCCARFQSDALPVEIFDRTTMFPALQAETDESTTMMSYMSGRNSHSAHQTCVRSYYGLCGVCVSRFLVDRNWSLIRKPVMEITSTLPNCGNSVYTSCYCEENIYWLIKRFLTPSGGEQQRDIFSVFISNPARTVTDMSEDSYVKILTFYYRWHCGISGWDHPEIHQ